MPAKSDNLIARHEYILQRLQETGTVVIDELCTTLEASIATIRRDLEDLEKPIFAQAHTRRRSTNRTAVLRAVPK